MNILRKITVSVLLSLLFLPVMAQQKADTTYTFRFVPQKDMFYVPWNGNDTELALPACWNVSKKTEPQFLTASCHFMSMATATRLAVRPRTLPRQRSVPIV